MPSPEAALLRTAIGLAPGAVPTAADLSVWLELARRQRVIPLLHELVSTSEHQLDEEQLRRIQTAQLDVMAAAVRLEHELLESATVLDEAGIEHAVLKGLATAHLDHRDPSLRQAGDVDVLVHPADFGHACSVLEGHGWRQAYVLPRHHERFTHALTFRRPSGLEVDLHQRIAHRALGLRISTDDLFEASIELTVAGARLRSLSPPDRLIHAAVHAVASRGVYRRLSGVADVLLLAQVLEEDSETVFQRANGWRVGAFVEQAVSDAYAAAALPIPAGWARRSLSGAPRDRVLEHAYLGDDRRPLAEEVAYLRVLPGWRNRWAYLAGYFALDAEYAERKRRHGRAAQVRYLWSRLRPGRGSRSD